MIICGDAREVLAGMDAESVHSVITSPPYWGLRDYSDAVECVFSDGWKGQFGLEPTPEMYVEHTLEFLRAIRRVLRKDGCVWWNLGDSYASVHTGGQKSAKSTVGANQPGIQEIRQPKAEPHTYGLKNKDLVMIPFRVALAAQADGAADPKAMRIIQRVQSALLADYDSWAEVPANTKREIERLDEEYCQAHEGGWWVRSVIIWSKCLAHSVKVYAKGQKGAIPMTVGEMARLDPRTLNLWSGTKWVKVKRIEKAKQQTGLEIQFRNGLRVSCTPEHRWPTTNGLKAASQLKVKDVVKSFPLPQPRKSIDGIPDSFGYLVGLYIADGSKLANREGLQFSLNVEQDNILKRLQEFAGYYGESVSVHDYGNSRHANLHGPVATSVVLKYVNGTGAKTKHLSPEAWKRSNRFLTEVLYGYLNGDGHFDGMQWKLGFTRNDALADDLRCIGARLGMSVRIRRAWHTYQNGKIYGFRGSIADPEYRRTKDWEIIGIQKSKSRAFYDIEVESPHIFCLASGVATHNSNPMPESVRDRPTTSHEYVLLLTKSARYFYDADAIREPQKDAHLVSSNFGQLSETNKFSTLEGNRSVQYGTKWSPKKREYNPAGRNKRTVWTIATQPYPEAHFATFPEALVEPMILTTPTKCCAECGAGWERVTEQNTCFEGGSGAAGRTAEDVNAAGKWAGIQYGKNIKLGPVVTVDTLGFRPTCSCDAETKPAVVVDPFAGRGTVARGCRKNNRDWVMIEMNPDYIPMMKRYLAMADEEVEREGETYVQRRLITV